MFCFRHILRLMRQRFHHKVLWLLLKSRMCHPYNVLIFQRSRCHINTLNIIWINFFAREEIAINNYLQRMNLYLTNGKLLKDFEWCAKNTKEFPISKLNFHNLYKIYCGLLLQIGGKFVMCLKCSPPRKLPASDESDILMLRKHYYNTAYHPVSYLLLLGMPKLLGCLFTITGDAGVWLVLMVFWLIPRLVL